MGYKTENIYENMSVEKLLDTIDQCLKAENVDNYGYLVPSLLKELKQRGVDKEPEIDPELLAYVRQREENLYKRAEETLRQAGLK